MSTLRHLWKNCSVWVPADIVFNGRRPQLGVPSPFLVSTSNGLGAGLSREQAITQALGELIERDAVSCIEQRASHIGAAFILSLARLIGRDESSLLEQFRDNTDLALTIDPASLPPDAITLYKKFQEAGLNVQWNHSRDRFTSRTFIH